MSIVYPLYVLYYRVEYLMKISATTYGRLSEPTCFFFFYCHFWDLATCLVLIITVLRPFLISNTSGGRRWTLNYRSNMGPQADAQSMVEDKNPTISCSDIKPPPIGSLSPLRRFVQVTNQISHYLPQTLFTIATPSQSTALPTTYSLVFSTP